VPLDDGASGVAAQQVRQGGSLIGPSSLKLPVDDDPKCADPAGLRAESW